MARVNLFSETYALKDLRDLVAAWQRHRNLTDEQVAYLSGWQV